MLPATLRNEVDVLGVTFQIILMRALSMNILETFWQKSNKITQNVDGGKR